MEHLIWIISLAILVGGVYWFVSRYDTDVHITLRERENGEE